MSGGTATFNTTIQIDKPIHNINRMTKGMTNMIPEIQSIKGMSPWTLSLLYAHLKIITSQWLKYMEQAPFIYPSDTSGNNLFWTDLLSGLFFSIIISLPISFFAFVELPIWIVHL